MKQLSLLIMTILLCFSAQAAEERMVETKLCRVLICNKLSRFSLSPWSHMKDSMGESCFEATIPKQEAQEGKVLDSSSRWYQGSSINPTKKSVTKIKRVLACQE